jgi:hypothetical protein
MKINSNSIKQIKQISRAAFKIEGVRSFAFRNKKKYYRKQKHPSVWQ